MKTFIKDPQANLDYLVDWSAYLGADTIVSSTFTSDAGIAQGATSNTGSEATVWLSGGAVGTSYKIVNSIVTAGGRTDERTFSVVIANR